MSEKPRIVLIPDTAWWVIGQMGKQVIARFNEKYDFYFLPTTLLCRRPDLVRDIVAAADVIHCMSDYDGIEFFAHFDRRELPPIVTWVHHVTQWNENQRLALEMSSALTVCTGEWKQLIEKQITRPIPITVVPHGIDTELFRRQSESRERFGIPPDRFVVGFVAKKGSDLDHGRKGTDVLFGVVRKAASSIPNFHLLMGGPGWEKDVASLQAQGISASGTGYIRKADLPALYSALDVYLVTSRVEGGPCTVLEAMSCETAVVSTRVGAVPQWIIDGVNGYSAEIGDVEGLLRGIMALYHSPEHNATIVREGRSTALAHSWSKSLSPLESVYDALTEKRRAPKGSTPGPHWMRKPDRLLRAACAADALLCVYGDIRAGSLKILPGLKMLREILSEQSLPEIVRGAAMVRRVPKSADR